jgi:hypothetical protein
MRRSGGAARAEQNDIPKVLPWPTHPPDPFRDRLKCPVDATAALAPIELAPMYRIGVELSIMRQIFMRNKQAGNGTPNSAADPLPTTRNSADGRSAKIVLKTLIYNEFLTAQHRNLDTETCFSPDLRGKSTR